MIIFTQFNADMGYSSECRKVWLFGGKTQSPGLLVQALTPRHHTEKLDFNP